MTLILNIWSTLVTRGTGREWTRSQHTGSSEYNMSSARLFTHANQGGDVFLRIKADYNQERIYSNDHEYPSFSGWKLY